MVSSTELSGYLTAEQRREFVTWLPQPLGPSHNGPLEIATILLGESPPYWIARGYSMGQSWGSNRSTRSPSESESRSQINCSNLALFFAALPLPSSQCCRGRRVEITRVPGVSRVCRKKPCGDSATAGALGQFT
eukprot:s319_g28.t1